MPYCSSCGSEIPEGQGLSCSMCYGDISYGRDGYYEQWAHEQEDCTSSANNCFNLTQRSSVSHYMEEKK